MVASRHRYRVWMRDGSMFFVVAESEEAARTEAVELAKKSLVGLAMSPADKRKASQVDYVNEVN